jgi:glycerophosphoryl diester phosphodiesterase
MLPRQPRHAVTRFSLLADAIRDARASWRPLATTDLVYKLAALALLTPVTVGLLHWAMSRAGASVIADTEIATFFLTTRQGLLALFVCGAMFVAITALELACLMAIGVSARNGGRQTVRGALAFGAVRAVPVLRLALNIVVRLLVGVLPFVLGIGLVYWTLLRHHDINFYLATRPGPFIAAVVLAAVIVIALVVVLVRTIARWSLALPLVLFEQVSPRRALGESARSVPHRGVAVSALAGWAILAVALLAVAAWVPQFAGRRLAPAFAGSVEELVVFIAAWAMFYAALAIAVAVVNASLLAMVLVGLYVRSGPPAGSGLQFSKAEPEGSALHESALQMVKIAAVLAIVLAVAGAALVVVNLTKRNQPVLVIAHRGASAAAPENTLAAFGLAADQRADFVELDVQESADGEVMVVHDSDLMKVGRSALRIWEGTAAELRAVDVGSHKNARFSSERVPTLAEALAHCRDRVRVIVELKTYGHGQRLVERVIEVIEGAGVVDQTVFMSLDHDLVRQLKQRRPSWRVGALVAKAIGDVTGIDADFLAVEAGLATRAMVRDAHRAGKEVYVWTVNEPVRMLRAMSHGVDGLITDVPDIARRFVERRSAMSDAQRVLVALLVATGGDAERLVGEQEPDRLR